MQLRLLPKMLLYILLPAVAGLCVLTYAANRLATEGMRSQIHEDLQLAVNVQARELENILGLVSNITLDFSLSPSVVAYLEGVEGGMLPPGEVYRLREEVAVEVHDLATSIARIRSLVVVNLKGEALINSNSTVPLNVADRAYFKEAVNGKVSCLSVVSKTDNSAITVLAMPVKSGNRVVGVIYSSMSMDDLAKSTTDLIKVANTGACYVYDKDGRTIMHTNRKLIGDDNKDHPWTWEILRDPRTEIQYNWNGVEKVAFYAKVPIMGWWVVLGVDQADLFSPITRLTNTLLLIAGGVTLLVGLIIFFVARDQALVLAQGANFTAYVAQGNLNVTADQKQQLSGACSRGDEIGVLARSVGTLVENLSLKVAESEDRTRQAEVAMKDAHQAREAAEIATQKAESARRDGMMAAAGQLESAVAVISSASTELSAQIELSERGSARQADSLSETATAMNQMNSTVLEVARNASQASDVSLHTRKKAEEGATVVRKAVESIQDVQRQAIRMKEDMGKLEQNAQAINHIMGVISDIADQTNLLALNAAIEAARAGEAGRGFAVVADEVRKLAEKTMASTSDVGNAIKAIQESASLSMSQMDASVGAVENATLYANQSGEALREIVALVDNTSDQVRAIATASEEQSASSEQINSAISRIHGIAGETAGAMREAAQAVNDLARQAQVLDTLIEEMKRS